MTQEKMIKSTLRNIPPSIENRLKTMASKIKNIVSLYGGEPEFTTPQHIIDAAKKALDEGHTHYAPFTGLPELKEAIANYYKQYDVEVDPETVFPTVGGTLGLYIAIQSVTEPGSEFIVEDPGYMAYPWLIQFAGGTVITVPRYEEKEYRLDPKDIEKVVTPRTKGIVICNPDNPTGAVLAEDELMEIAEIAKRYDLLVISDDIYDRIIYDGLKFHSIAAFPDMLERTIIVNGCSKTYAMTGWRLGYIITPKDLMNAFMDHLTRAFLTVSTVVQMAGVAALKGPQDCVEKMVNAYDRKRRLMVSTLDSIEGVSCVMPKGAFYAFPNVSSLGLSSLELTEFLLKEAKVLLRPGALFGSNGEGHLRFSFSESMETVKEALARFEEGVNKLRKK